MHSAWTLFTLLLASAAPALAGKCAEPRDVGENPNCLGGSYMECVSRNNALCTGECFNQPAGGAGAQCHTSCTTRNQQYCSGYCMKISNCDECKESLVKMGGVDDDKVNEDTCSQEGDSYYCNCDA
ncbi:hypothetical protein FVEN_g6803 [Fusarium venenatum]|uniref:Uncharacterized protein n=1 Tax=Fusarium venenatum TaxID=56646 RepID=A0A2L2SZT0_9HYPO|nr:uncharacterized protein FVRRES_00194 [Fusarium venenatum]KAG8355240.1 hypothetical protein FVEN_g6803 [Fusarium venenatum]CEI63682.1 unnamed protein product [Fusarium venenatum]